MHSFTPSFNKDWPDVMSYIFRVAWSHFVAMQVRREILWRRRHILQGL